MGSFGFATDLGVRQRRVAASAAPPSTITSLQILDSTVLPDGADAAIPNGWVAKATLPDDGDATFDPGKISLTVQDPGFDTDGNAVTVVRTITGTEIVRKQHPNQAERLNAVSGGLRTVYFALSEDVYAGSVIKAANAAAGYHGAAPAGSIGGVVNGSTLAYPLPTFAWLNMQHERATGTGFSVEAVVYHALARNGQQVACVEFFGRDAAGGNLTAMQRASIPELSDLQTQGNVVECWKATIPLATLPQGDLCQVVAMVKPWIGAALDLSVAGPGAFGTLRPGTPVDTAQPETPLRFLCDKTGGYGGNEAWVKASASGGAVGSGATPFPTVQAALAALVAANGSGKGHADHSGSTVWLMDDGGGGAVDHAIGATNATAAGKCWTDIRVDPSASGQVRLTLSGLVGTADLLRFCVPIHIDATGNNTLDGGSSPNVKRIGFDAGAVVTNGANLPAQGLTFRFGLGYWRDVAFSGARSPFATFGTNRNAAVLVLGCTGTIEPTVAAYPYAFIGNRIEGLRIEDVPIALADAFPQAGMIVANNVLTRMSGGMKLGGRALSGVARVQNVLETASGFPAGGEAINLSASGTQPAANVLSMHNTVPGSGIGSSNQARQLACYADIAGDVGVERRMVERFELVHQRNVKTDTFTSNTSVTGRTGNWRLRYGVGNLGNVVVTGDAQNGTAVVPDPSGGNWSGEYLEPGSSWAAGEANVTFADNRSGSAGAGGGDYALTGAANAAYDRVPAGRAVLRYDLAGTLRRNDGTGAAGAYERTD